MVAAIQQLANQLGMPTKLMAATGVAASAVQTVVADNVQTIHRQSTSGPMTRSTSMTRGARSPRSS